MRRLIATLVVIVVVHVARGEDATQFRGPGGLGVSKETNLPVQWSEKQNLRWKADLPGRGLSNPVIAGGRVYVTASSGYQEKRLHILCFDVKDGKKLWERQFWATGTTLCHTKTNMAAPTPVTDGQRVVALFATCDLVCLDKDGNLEWYRSLVGDYPTVGNNVGMAASPTLWKDLVIVCLENAGESFAAGIDIKTGQNRWRFERPRGINWVTPLVIDNKGQAEVLFQSGAELTAHDAATGKKRWTLTGRGLSTIPSPTFGDGMVLASGGKFLAVQPGAPDKEPKVLWESSKLPTGYSSPVYHDGKVYALSTRGVVNCADAKDGKPLWDQRVDGDYSASPLIADGKMYVVNEEGTTTVIQLGVQPKVLATNALPGTVLATPVASDSAIFLRTDQSLYCIGARRK